MTKIINTHCVMPGNLIAVKNNASAHATLIDPYDRHLTNKDVVNLKEGDTVLMLGVDSIHVRCDTYYVGLYSNRIIWLYFPIVEQKFNLITA